MTSVMMLMEDYLGSYTRAVGTWLEGRSATFEEASRWAFAQSIYYGDAYLHAFAEAGVRATQLVPTCRPLQALWARDLGIHALPAILDRRPFRWPWTRTGRGLPSEALSRRVLEEQIRQVKPDVVWVFSGITITADQIERWRKHVGLVALWWSCPLNDRMPYASFDLILSCIPGLVDHFRSLGIRAEYMPHAFDGRILERVPRSSDGARLQRVAFVGNLSRAHQQRVEFFDALSREVEIDFYGTGKEELPVDSPLRAHFHGPAWGDDLYRIYGNYALVVHRNIGTAGTSASAKRLFEASGMGACVITEADAWLPQLFQPDHEMATYETIEGCVETVQGLLSTPIDLASIAGRGQARTLRDHTYEARVAQVLALFEG